MGHGWEGVVLKLFRGRDFTFTVTGAEQVTEDFRRVTVTDGGLLAATGGAHPTMWVKLCFERDGKPHQRGYTLVDPDPARCWTRPPAPRRRSGTRPRRPRRPRTRRTPRTGSRRSGWTRTTTPCTPCRAGTRARTWSPR